jgi:transcriptional regulator with XRE-family HTH domain/quercetin dioxygenase-like cupin family protein
MTNSGGSSSRNPWRTVASTPRTKAQVTSSSKSVTSRSKPLLETKTRNRASSTSSQKSLAEKRVERKTVSRLSTDHVGPRLRERREALGVSLRQFARELEVSASFISQLETGKARPSVATLYAICEALDLSVDDLFATEPTTETVARPLGATASKDKRARPSKTRSTNGARRVGSIAKAENSGSLPLVRPSERKTIVLDSGVTWERLTPTTGAKSNFLYIRYEVGGSSTSDGSLLQHSGTEYWYVLRGALEVVLGFETYRVNAGDAITFDSSTPHRLANSGDEPAEAIRFDQGSDHSSLD